MIRYALQCNQDHEFESWFQSADAYDKLREVGMVECAVCGSSDIRKKVMAPSISKTASSGSTAKARPVEPEPSTDKGPAAEAPSGPLSAPASVAEQALRELRAKIEANSENVGRNFAREARRIHHGEAPERAIIGEARLDEAKALAEEGISLAPLPFSTSRKTN